MPAMSASAPLDTAVPLGAHWGWLFAGGVAGIVLGVMLLVGWPVTAIWGIGVLLGINLIFTGAMNCSLALSSKARIAHAV